MKNLLVWFVVVFFLLSISTQFYVYQTTTSAVDNYQLRNLQGKSTAVVNLCINYPPVLNNTCPTRWNETVLFDCTVNGTDANGGSLTFTSHNLSSLTLYNITSAGRILFTPNQSHVGNRSMNISLSDNSGCSNGVVWENYTIEILNINNPPVWTANIPDQEIDEQVQVVVFDLDDFVYDPDGDALNYDFIGGVSGLNVTVDSEHRVSIYANSCLGEIFPVWFDAEEATTPEQYRVSSNQFKITINCQTSGGTDDNTQGGDGGGGGSSRQCVEDWQCRDWGPCFPNGTQTRLCVDYGGCDPNDYLRYQTRACEYPKAAACVEQWECGAWGACIDGNQTRTCKDKHNCGTFLLLPNSTRECTVEIPSNFTGPELPPVEDEFPWLTYIIIIAIILLAILVIIYRVYKKQIREIIARIGWYITKKRRKQILLTDEQKEKLLKRLIELEKKIPTTPINQSGYYLSEVVRQYFSYVYKLNQEFSKEDFLLAWKKMKVDDLLKKVFASFFEFSYQVEFNKYQLLPYELLAFMDEMRLLIFQTSNATRADGEHQVKHRKTVSRDKVDVLFTQISNALIPTQFNESVYGKNAYLTALKLFEGLKLSEQEKIYPYLDRLYNEINYVSHLVQTAKLT